MKQPQFRKTVKIYAYLTPSEKKSLDEAVRKSGLSRAEFVERAVKKGIKG